MAHPASLADGRETFVYMLLPHAGGYRVMRAPLKQLLEISEAVSNVPGAEPAASDGSGGEAVAPGKGGGFRAEDIARMQGRLEQGSRVGWVRFGEVEIDAAARVVTRAGQAVPLAPLEFDLLVALFQRKGAAASREELFELLRHALAKAGNATLMTTELMDALVDHSAGNYRLLMTMGAELLAYGMAHEVAQLDEKFYLELYHPQRPSVKKKARV